MNTPSIGVYLNGPLCDNAPLPYVPPPRLSRDVDHITTTAGELT